MTELKKNDPLIFHFRVGKDKTEAMAGATVAFRPDLMRFGIALCCSKDRFNKRWGRKIALVRAEHGDKAGRRARVNSRFNCSPTYMGLMDLESVRNKATELVQDAARAVGNDLVESEAEAEAEAKRLFPAECVNAAKAIRGLAPHLSSVGVYARIIAEHCGEDKG